MAAKKRRGVIRLSAATLIWSLAQTLNQDVAKVFASNVERWLDNGHNLDEDDVAWLANEARDAVNARKLALGYDDEHTAASRSPLAPNR